jgi:glutathione S-transferase
MRCYSPVDTHLASTVGWIASLELIPGDLPTLGSWLQRCSSRPAFARVMSDDVGSSSD